ncbi:MAG TPA: His/Gly/Thr/Pro-type tRNA ligase C-terminal domain-containing protein, partial [Thermomicrobiales bacterium]|nr:His/Gly/Thr/Pro-type tRNA ligase C-terminal domain-containing protein [Thermomicrobiales bacterium]
DCLKPAVRVRVDWRDDRTPGYKFTEWELKGVPLRLEIGPREAAANAARLVRRDTRARQDVTLARLGETVVTTLAAMQANLFTAARRTRDEHIAMVDRSADLAERVADNAGWSLAHWCGAAACEARVKAETKATIRCIPSDAPDENGRCVVCGGHSDRRVVFARAY